jgi:hypothetical protein
VFLSYVPLQWAAGAGVPHLHFLSNLGLLASFSHSHMTNKQEYKQKKILEHLYQQYVKLDFVENCSFFGSFVIL